MHLAAHHQVSLEAANQALYANIGIMLLFVALIGGGLSLLLRMRSIAKG